MVHLIQICKEGAEKKIPVIVLVSNSYKYSEFMTNKASQYIDFLIQNLCGQK